MITLAPLVDTFAIRVTRQFTATLRDAAGETVTGRRIEWSSSDTMVAVVDSLGRATGIRPGFVWITARYQALTGIASVRVRGMPATVRFDAPASVPFGSRLNPAPFIHATDTLGAADAGPVSLSLHDTSAMALIHNLQPNPMVQQLYARAAGTATFHLAFQGATASASTIVTPVDYAYADAGCAITTDQNALCWGYSYLGALGDGPYWHLSTLSPQAVSGGHRFISVQRGRQFGCGLDVAGEGWCWGINDLGQLGNEHNGECHMTDDTCSAIPVRVAGGHRFKSLAVSPNSACALSLDGRAYCWGSNASLQLGSATSTTCAGQGFSGRWEPDLPCSREPVAAGGDLRFVSLDTDGDGWVSDRTCGVTSQGALYCWGSDISNSASRPEGPCRNLAGQPYACSATPSRVAPGETWASVSVGRFSVCALATDGDAFCNWSGISLTPEMQPVPGGLKFRSVTAGSNSACGVATDGTGYCWGAGYGGVLGTGSTADSPTPVRVPGLSQLQAIRMTQLNACALDVAGSVFCWGLSQFDLNTWHTVLTPTRVPDGT